MSDPRIQFDDGLHPVRSQSAGVYRLRSREVAGVGSIHTPSQSRSTKNEAYGMESETNVEDRDYKPKQSFTGWPLAWLAYQSIGVIYGDIGTSPLYVYSSTFTANPSYEDLLGALSLIIWSVTIMVTVKYCLIILRADDEGEGGTFALFSLLSRHANIVRRDPREEQMVRMERHITRELGKPAQKTRNLMERSRFLQWILKIMGVFGVALVMSDGILTPAQSVLGAIQGISVASPGISNGAVVGVSCTILVFLFLLQPFGVTKLASSFAPIVIIWLLLNAVFGIYNLVQHDHTVLKAFSPYFAGAFLVRNKIEGWKSLGGILLAFTGCEALFADLGAFTLRAVQLSWLLFAFPCLLLGYVGQASYIAEDPTAWTNPFYNTVPPGCLYPSLVIAILAAVVASQAMITAVFQLLSQIMKLSYFPQIKAVHTSKVFFGQIYIPMANWLLMIGTVVVTAVYNNTTNLGHAYGVCVILVTFFSTCMVALVALIVWKVPAITILIVWLIFALFDGAFLSSSLTKVPEGAWFTLVLAVVLSSVFILWRFGKEQQWHAEASDRFPPSHMLRTTDGLPNAALQLTGAFGSHQLTRINGIGVFFDKTGAPSTTPTVFIHFLQKFHAACDVIIFFHLRPLHIPTVAPGERYTVTQCYVGSEGQSRRPMPNCYRIIIRHGYTDEVVTHNLGLLLYEQVRDFICKARVVAPFSPSTNGDKRHNATIKDVTFNQRSIDASRPSFESTNLELVSKLAELRQAYDSQVVYIVGKEQMRIKAGTNIARRALLELFLWIRENSRTKVQALNIAVDKLVEVGFVKEV
ncbi:potassium uptake protein [Exophiala aquamarina CBS 119918]|uniref:Potassium uptake protein n=1 Tax=Exophiala aquamarina CBS 119918 TaxID=1182545 RepID=A0A072Q5N8_9EURO|nr:potassium uptake protein [Exophiala aquamarina CBS 119918]KEF63235.1 potassium uptake protein [Exophiala aquamarina CBS 119918]